MTTPSTPQIPELPELTAAQLSLLRTYTTGPKIWDAANLWADVCGLAARQLIAELTTAEGAVRGGCYRLTGLGHLYLRDHPELAKEHTP